MAMNKNSEEDEGMANQLPEDVLTCILCCLAPRFLAVSRCVCKTWCDIIDAHNLLCADLLPHSVSGIFISFNDLTLPKFFSHPTTGPTIWGNFDFLPCRGQLRDYCNGLLLIHDFVVNPATRQWVQLPPCPRPLMSFRYFIDKDYLVFDPSLHRTMRTKRWEERSFAREGEAAGTVAHMRSDWAEGPRNAVYWRGTLYIHCQTNFVMRISLSDNKYKVIKPPANIKLADYPNFYLGRLEKGVYCVLDDLLSVYILNESNGEMEWVLKCDIILRHQQIDRPGPWTLQDSINYRESHGESEDGNNEVKLEWDSDNDNVIDTDGRSNNHDVDYGYFTFLGFHPYKEVAFLSDTLKRGLAYHLNSSKVQDLGNIWPANYGTDISIRPSIKSSFPYTPWMGKLPEDQ